MSQSHELFTCMIGSVVAEGSEKVAISLITTFPTFLELAAHYMIYSDYIIFYKIT